MWYLSCCCIIPIPQDSVVKPPPRISPLLLYFLCPSLVLAWQCTAVSAGLRRLWERSVMKMVSYLNHPHLCHPPTVSNHSPSSLSGNISLSFSPALPHVVLFTTKKGLFSNCQPRMMTDRNYGICHPNLLTVLRKGIMVWWKPDTKKLLSWCSVSGRLMHKTTLRFSLTYWLSF